MLLEELTDYSNTSVWNLSNPSVWNPSNPSVWNPLGWNTPDIKNINELEELYYEINIDNDDNIIEIKNKRFIFKCSFIENRIQPYEYIMGLINKKCKLNVKIIVSDILTISYVNLVFINIKNNLIFNDFCNFSKLEVKFKYDKILYENHRLSLSELN